MLMFHKRSMLPLKKNFPTLKAHMASSGEIFILLRVSLLPPSEEKLHVIVVCFKDWMMLYKIFYLKAKQKTQLSISCWRFSEATV